MFSDRLWIVKAAAALGLFSLLCTVSHRDLRRAFPPFESIPAAYPHNRGRVYFIHARPVVEADPQGFEIRTRVGPLYLRTPTPPPPSTIVSVNARVVGPRTLEVVDQFTHTGYTWKRPLNYVISILTVIGFLWVVRRRFRWPIRDGVFRSRY